MGRRSNGKKGTSKKKQETDGSWMLVDPERIRFQHSRIRPYFSGCGRSVTETLESIRRNELSPSDLPPIQVLVGPEDESGRWYFSLNNRRLWVLKRCREEGLLENNVVRVRVRTPKSESELKRYTLANCALEARFLRATDSQKLESTSTDGSTEPSETKVCEEQLNYRQSSNSDNESSIHEAVLVEATEDDDTESESDEECVSRDVNPFSALA